MLYTLDDLTNKGQVCVVLRPHQRPCEVLDYASVDEAFDLWVAGKLAYWSNFTEFSKDFPDEDFLTLAKEKLDNAGINPDEEFVEFSICEAADYEFLPSPIDKMELLERVVGDDMYGARVFVADGQSYREWIDEIYRYTRGHNEPSVGKIMDALMVEGDSEEEE